MKKVLALTLATIMVLCIVASPAQAAGPVDQATFFGTVVDSHSSPLSNVTITAQNTTTGVLITGKTNETGAYTLSVPVGIYNITAGLNNYTANTTYRSISVLASSGPYNFTMTEQLGIVQGNVVSDDNSGPVFNVVITLSSDHHNYSARSVSPLGYYSISGIEPGTYVAYAEKMGYNQGIFSVPLIITRTSVLVVNFTMTEQPAEIYGVVTDKNDDPLSGVEVKMVPSDGTQSIFITTDSNGNYTISGLSAGSYTITFEKDGYDTITKTMDFGPYEEKRVDLTLEETPVEVHEILFGYDLVHSLMILGFGIGMVLVIAGIVISMRSRKKPEILAPIEKHADEKKDD